ncbi:MAG: glutamyl-tRNA synthetase [Frankiales bacterium]|jgi:glutamyl-tRNA synthetase|nr:glutamyl-tRNA synthetase [Frankiales bacterium]
MIRTALFNWAYARHTGGTFVFRIEDTDPARDSEESYHLLLDVLRWLGLDWDEGPDIGGPHAPYRQSQRMGLYRDVAERLRRAGLAYACYCTTDEIDARNKAAGRPPGYDNHCRSLSSDQLKAFEGRDAVLRLRMPDTPLTWDDLVRGEVTFQPEHVPDFVIMRANGNPLYTLTNPVDDALMEITHVLRGEDLLSSTPRQIGLYGALAAIGVGNGSTPRFGHLPYVMGEGNKKLSKRDPEANAMLYRERGFLPEGLVNYLALLGWSFGDDIEIFSPAEMVTRFDVTDVNASPARFDLRKCEAINAAWVRRLEPDDLAKRILIQLAERGVLGPEPTDDERALVSAATPLVQERMVVLEESVGMLGFLFADAVEIDEAAAAKQLGPDQQPTLAAAVEALQGLGDWTAAAIEAALREALVEGLGLKPKNAFGPVRVAVTGRTVSPPLFESLELLGRDRTLARLVAAQSR